MSHHYILIAVFIVALQTVAFTQTKSMMIAGVARTYIIHAPSGLTKPPLLFNIHGYNMDASSQQSYTKMDQIADREKFVVVYPNAINKSWDLTGENDYAFILAIIDSVDAKYKIDKSRIYSCGFSQGGFMTFQLACRYSDIFAAIAPTSGLLNGTCNPKRPLSMRLIFGTDEGFDGGTASFMKGVESWLKICNCPRTPVVMRPYPSSNSKSVVTRLYYGPCDKGTEVIADSVRTGQHEWPMNTSDRVNNSEETWAFLKKITLQNATNTHLNKSLVAIDAITIAFFSGTIRLHGVDENCKVQMFDTRGRSVAVAALMNNNFGFKCKSSGLYMIKVKQNNTFTTFRIAIP